MNGFMEETQNTLGSHCVTVIELGPRHSRKIHVEIGPPTCIGPLQAESLYKVTKMMVTSFEIICKNCYESRK